MKRIRNWKLDIRNLEKEILVTIQYFLFFNYPPTFLEIHTFLKKKCSKQALDEILEKMEKEAVISIQNKGTGKEASLGKGLRLGMKSKIPTSLSNNYTGFLTVSQHLGFSDSAPRYTRGEYSNKFKVQSSKFKTSIQKIKEINQYVHTLSRFPQIKLIGLSGSTAMLNADKEHDVDLFIITAKNRLFTGRFIALLLAQLMGIRRLRHSGERGTSESRIPLRFWTSQNDNVSNKVCLNLFFDESELLVPKFKKTEYVAHEILQMKPFDEVYPEGTRGTQSKPLEQKGDIYRRFIDANKWVFDIFPNARNTKSGRTSAVSSYAKASEDKEEKDGLDHRSFSEGGKTAEVNVVANLIESLLKSIQLYFIRRHKTTEIITDTQLWFHPDDFGKKIKNNTRII